MTDHTTLYVFAATFSAGFVVMALGAMHYLGAELRNPITWGLDEWPWTTVRRWFG